MKTMILLLMIIFSPVLSKESKEEKFVLSNENGKWEINVLEENWIPIKVPSNAHEYISSSSFWLRYTFEYPFENTHQLSLFLGTISDRDKTYLNGIYIGGMGEFGSRLPQAYDRERIYNIPFGVLQKGENVLLIKVESYFPYESGLLTDTPIIAKTEFLQAEFYSRNYQKLIFLFVYLIAGFYFVFLFIRRKKDYSNLLFALSSFGVVVYQFLRNQLKFELGVSFLELKRWEYISLCLSIPFYCNFVYHFFEPDPKTPNSMKKVFIYNKIDLLNKIISYYFKAPLLNTLNIISLILVCFYLISNEVLLFDKVNKNFMQPIFFIYCSYVLYFLFQKTREKNKDALYMFTATVVLVISVFTDILSDRGYFNFPRTVGYAFLTYEISIALILANKTVRLHNEVEELNEKLEQKVEERTNELNQSLQEIKELKLQQDADYFLTTLLLNPLLKNENKSENVKSEFYLSQKKKFEFRKKFFEIGGDVNLTSNICLEGKQYTVFINGDAMGKSIQGAGGALVFGVIFKSILMRSNIYSFKGVYPERWLKDVFFELQTAFETFSGSMFISLVLGLIEDKTGLLYYINAEHPKTVLLRNGKASFLENEQTLRKLGIPGNEEIFKVFTFLLENGDILFAGSDGRDDLITGEIDGVKIYNEDEFLFLRKVEDSKGDLKTLIHLIQTTGEITDDFSLLKIEYKNPEIKKKKIVFSNLVKNLYTNDKTTEEHSVIEKVYIMKALYRIMPTNEFANYTLALHYYRNREFPTALKHVLLYNQTKPDSISLLYLEAKLQMLCKNFEESLKTLEKLKLRDPHYKKAKKLTEKLEGHYKKNPIPTEITLVTYKASRNGIKENAL